MRTLHVEPGDPEALRLIQVEIERLLDAGKSVAVTVGEEGEWLSASEVAKRVGCSRQELEWLIRVGELEAHLLGDERCWQVSLSSVVELEARRESARRRATVFDDLMGQLRAL